MTSSQSDIKPFYLNIILRMVFISLVVFFSIRLFMSAFYSEYFSSTSLKDMIVAYIYGMRFDLALIFMTGALCFLWLIIPVKWFHQKRIRQVIAWLYGVILAILASVYLGDVYYFGEVERHIGRELFSIGLSDANAIISMAFSVAPLFTCIGLLSIFVFLILWWRFVIIPCGREPKLPQSASKKLFFFLASFLLIVFFARGMIVTSRPIGVIEAFEMPSLQTANLSLNGSFVVLKQFSRPKDQKLRLLKADEYERLNKIYLTKNQFSQPKLSAQSGESDLMAASQIGWQKDWYKKHNQKPSAIQGKPKNVVIILLESWSARYIDELSHHGYKATPFFDQLIRKSLVFDRMYAAGQRSIFGIQASFSAIPVLHNYPSLGFGLETNRLSKMGKAAKEQGYATFFAQTSNRRSYHVDGIAKLLEFDHYFGKEDVEIIKSYPQNFVPSFGWDYDSLIHLNKVLNKQYIEHPNQPFISMLFTGSTHAPYPNLDQSFNIRKHNPKTEDGFLNTLRYSDWSLEQFMKEASKTNWYNDTVFIFLADHTNSVVGAKDLDEQFRIPLVMFAPDGSLPAGVNHTVVSQYDILPTVMDLIQSPKKIASFGRSVFDDVRLPYALIAKGSVYGVINEKGWATFSGIKNIDNHTLGEGGPAVMNTLRDHARWRLQFTDRLLRKNEWLPPQHQ